MMKSRLEFKPDVGLPPVEVTVRERRDYSFNLAAWLKQFQVVSSPTARMTETVTGAEVAGVVSGVAMNGDSVVNLTVDWQVSTLKKNTAYKLWVRGQVGSQFKEGFASFETHFQ